MSDRFMTLPEIRRAAKRLLPPGPWGFAAGGAETETTLRRNRQAIHRLAIRQRVLVDVRNVDLSTTFLGMELLREELSTSLALCGQTSVRGLKPSLIRRAE